MNAGDIPFKAGADFSAAVLAGGKGRRLGADKTTLVLNGEPVLDHIVSSLLTVFSSLLLVVQADSACFAGRYGPEVKVVSDLMPGKGPMVGIYTALEYARTPYLFVMACDMPYPNLDLVRTMLSLAPGREAVVPRRGDYIEPLFAVYSREIREKMRRRLEAGRLKIHELIEDIDVRFLQEDEIAACDPHFRSFLNINTPDDLMSVEAGPAYPPDV